MWKIRCEVIFHILRLSLNVLDISDISPKYANSPSNEREKIPEIDTAVRELIGN